jgi:hypothetical protein
VPPAKTNVDNFFSNDQTLLSTNAGATEAPGIDLDRNSASPAVADVIGAIRFKGRDSGGNTTTYGKVSAEIVDKTGGTEDGKLVFATMIAGATGHRFHIGAGLYVEGNTDPGTGKVDADDFLISGTSVNSTLVTLSSHLQWSLLTTLDTSSGTSTQTTAIPSTTIMIRLLYEGVSSDATNESQLELGSTTYSTTGNGQREGQANGSQDVGVWGSGVMELSSPIQAAAALYGTVTLTKTDDHLWVVSSVLASVGHTALILNSAGFITLSAAMDRLRVSPSAGNQDAGQVHVWVYS